VVTAFWHLEYDDSSKILLFIPALDQTRGSTITALSACCTFADSQEEGYSTEDREGQKNMEPSENDTLMAKQCRLSRLTQG
jgi:hypothetical protein